jgi:hypothetical protein
MTPKEKAETLIDKMKSIVENSGLHATFDYDCYKKAAVKCALIAIDEIVEILEGLNKPEYCAFDAIGERKFHFNGEYETHMTGYDMFEYWEQVKKEIEAL